MFSNLPNTATRVPPEEPEPDFEHGLFLSEKLGHEFNAMGKSGILTQMIIPQGFAILFLVPFILFFGIRNVLGGSLSLALPIAIVTGVVIISAGIVAMIRITGNRGTGFALTSTTDSRYRIRACIPKRRQNPGFRQWAEVTLNVKPKDPEEITPIGAQDLDAELGGFEPVIARPWFGIKRDSNYAIAAVICGGIGLSALMFFFQFLFGGWGAMFQNAGFLTYAAIGFTLVSGGLSAELIYPVYIRIVPGRLDVFRYGFLGAGAPDVKKYDLHKVGLCVDFGTFNVALEKPRPPGEPLPELVAAKKWPNHKIYPDGYTPDYFSLALSPGRTEQCQRLIQAARSTQTPPDLPDDQLIG